MLQKINAVVRAVVQVPDAAPPVPSINGNFVRLMIVVLPLKNNVICPLMVLIAIQIGNITTNMKNVLRRILVKVIVFFIPVFVLIQAVLWEENIKSAVDQMVAPVPVRVVITVVPALLAVLLLALIKQRVLCSVPAPG